MRQGVILEREDGGDGALVKLGHAKSATTNSDALALMEAEPELTARDERLVLGSTHQVAVGVGVVFPLYQVVLLGHRDQPRLKPRELRDGHL